MKVAGEEHVVDVVAGAVVELPHVKGSWLEIVEISFYLQALQDALLHEMYVPDLVPEKKTDRAIKETILEWCRLTHLHA